VLLVLLTVLAVSVRLGRGQEYDPPDPKFPLPLYHDRPQENGGFYLGHGFLYYDQEKAAGQELLKTMRALLDLIYAGLEAREPARATAPSRDETCSQRNP